MIWLKSILRNPPERGSGPYPETMAGIEPPLMPEVAKSANPVFTYNCRLRGLQRGGKGTAGMRKERRGDVDRGYLYAGEHMEELYGREDLDRLYPEPPEPPGGCLPVVLVISLLLLLYLLRR